MLPTTSINQYYSMGSTTSASPLVIRPPKNLKVFRAHFIADNREDNIAEALVIISTQPPGSTGWDGVKISTRVYTETTTAVVPGTDISLGTADLNFYILDRRGVGYMVDDFYIYGKGGVSVIWEGIQEQ